MKLSIKKGVGFGLASGTITTLGLMVGLYSSTHSVGVVIGSILVIAVADSLSDALGIHVSAEYENQNTIREVWESTIATFLSKFIFALTFIVPVLIFSLKTAVIVSTVWGLSVLTAFSIHLAKKQNIKPYMVIMEHLAIAIFVIIVTYYIGIWVSSLT